MKFKKSITLMLLISSLGLAGCGAKSNSDSKTQSSESTSEKKEAKKTYDNYGDKLAIDYVPEHVITMGPNDTELFCALGLDQKVIGCSLNNHSRGPLKKYEVQYKNIKELTHGAPTKEAVLGTTTDFIYGIDWAFGEEGVDKKDLEEAKIPVMVNKAKTIPEEYNEIKQLGEIFHVEKRAEELIKNQKERINKVEQEVKNTKPVSVLVYDSGNNGIFTATGSNFETQLIEKAGGKNIFADIKDKAWTTVSGEAASKRNPDVIIVHDYDQPSIKEKIKEIKKDPALKNCRAVKENRFVVVPLEAVLPGARMAYTVEKFGHAFHPKEVKMTKSEEETEA